MAEVPVEPVDLDTIILSSSHFVPCDKVATENKFSGLKAEREGELAEARFQSFLPGINEIRAFSGLTLAPIEFEKKGWGLYKNPKKGHYLDKSDKRTDQMEDAREAMHSSSRSNALVVAGGNDFKWFIVDGKKPCPLTENGLAKWRTLKVKHKVNFSTKKHNILQPEGRDFIALQMEEFGKILGNFFKNSNFNNIFVSSIFERRIPEMQHLDIYFAHINYYLSGLIRRMNVDGTVLNRRGKPIKWHFINVASQFFNADSEGRVVSLFKQGERDTGVLTHRDLPHLREISKVFIKEISAALHSG